MKIKFNSDDNLPLNKTLKLHNMIIVIRSVFEEHGKFYLQVYLFKYNNKFIYLFKYNHNLHSTRKLVSSFL